MTIRHRASCRVASLVAVGLVAASTSAMAANGVNFKGRNVTIIIGSSTGGTTDLSTRLIASFLSKYLPSKPNVVVQNRPGAHSIIAMNYIAQQVKPDGLTLAGGSTSQINPYDYRVPQSHYDPSKFEMVGGIGIGGTIVIIRKEALPRLLNKKAAPVAMGSVQTFPQTGMQMTAWGIKYLGWNAKWVPGYRGLPPLILALERGEVDMTAFATTFLNRKTLLDKSKFSIIYQTGSDAGTVPASLPAVAKTPMFVKAMAGKIKDPLAQEAFKYWRNITTVTIWTALPPNTPKDIVTTYRTAYRKAVTDPTFLERGRKFSKDFSAISAESLTKTVKTLAEIPAPALNYMSVMLREQGLNVEALKEKRRRKKKK